MTKEDSILDTTSSKEVVSNPVGPILFFPVSSTG